MLTILTADKTIVNHYFSELRDKTLHADTQRFERNIERVSSLAAYELSRQLHYATKIVETPIKKTEVLAMSDKVVIAAILRAGLPVQHGLKSIFSDAEQAFVAAYRHGEPTKQGLPIGISYVATPPLAGKILVMADVMLATGNSIISAYQELISRGGKPKELFIIAVIASQTAVKTLTEHLPAAGIIAGTVDPKLTTDFMISPGLGDAGDILYGIKNPDNDASAIFEQPGTLEDRAADPVLTDNEISRGG